MKVKAKTSASPPASSQPEPLANRGRTEDDEAIAARMQAEYDAAIRGGRNSRRQAAPAPKKKKVKSKRKADDSDDDEPKKKKRAGGGGGAFNKPMILR